jgi:hypothetical protein
MGRNPHNRIGLRVKLLGTMQGLHSNAVLLDLVGGSGKMPLHHVIQKIQKVGRFVQKA